VLIDCQSGSAVVAGDTDAEREQDALAAAAAAGGGGGAVAIEPPKMNVWEARKKEQQSRNASATGINESM